jgi:hypothetical protein
MAIRIPLVIVAGEIQQLQTGDSIATGQTLAAAYTAGVTQNDSTLILTNTESEGGGAFTIDAAEEAYTETYAMEIVAPNDGHVSFPRVGGMAVLSSFTGITAANLVWNAIDFQSSVFVAVGEGTVTALAMVHIGAGHIARVEGSGNPYVTDVYNLRIDEEPTGNRLTRSWSLGIAGAVQMSNGLVLGAGLAPPTENDIVFGAGATVLSNASSGRIGFKLSSGGALGGFYASMEGAPYVPLLTAPGTAGFTPGSIPFSGPYGTLLEDNTNFFWNVGQAILCLGNPSSISMVATLALSLSKSLTTPTSGSTWDGFSVEGSELTVTIGSSADLTISQMQGSYFGAPTVLTTGGTKHLYITDMATVCIEAPTAAVNAVFANAWALSVNGNVKLNGGQTVASTPVNGDYPEDVYAVLPTDYILDVGRTVTELIYIGLPPLASTPNGRVIIVKDSGYNASVNSIYVTPNIVDSIEGGVAGESYEINVSGAALWFKANTLTGNWEII